MSTTTAMSVTVLSSSKRARCLLGYSYFLSEAVFGAFLYSQCPSCVSCAGPTWSSTTSEGCVAAIEQACNKICRRLQPHLQQKRSTWETWLATVAQVQEGSGLSPASVMLSAYGFYDGTARDEDGRTTKGGWRCQLAQPFVIAA